MYDSAPKAGSLWQPGGMGWGGWWEGGSGWRGHMHAYGWLMLMYGKHRQSVQFSCSVMSGSWWPHGLQHARVPCPSPAPGVSSNSCPLSRWCRPTISSSIVPFSDLQSLPASGSFPVSQFFISGGQSNGVSASASVLPMNIQDWFPLWLTGLISLQSKVASN